MGDKKNIYLGYVYLFTNRTLMEDHQLISQLKRRDRNALKDVYREYKTEFFRFASRYSKAEDILEDIFQDAIIAVYENALAGKLDNLKSSLKTYLFSTGKFMLFKKFRDTKEIATEETYIFDKRETAVMEDVYEDEGPNEHQKQLVANFKKLGDKCREILELFYLQGLKLEEIMGVQGYENKNVVKSQKSRCLKSLKELVATS